MQAVARALSGITGSYEGLSVAAGVGAGSTRGEELDQHGRGFGSHRCSLIAHDVRTDPGGLTLWGWPYYGA
jgi:predicted alpha/beta-hydrolase family hydrolase